MAPCVVYGCKTGYGPNSPKIPVHKFPDEKMLRQKWIHQINRDDFKPTEHSRVCERHFVEAAFTMVGARGKPLKTRHLTEWAYPTLFLRPEKQVTPRVTENSSAAKKTAFAS